MRKGRCTRHGILSCLRRPNRMKYNATLYYTYIYTYNIQINILYRVDCIVQPFDSYDNLDDFNYNRIMICYI